MANVVDNTEEARFELIEEGLTAYADYRRQDGRLIIDYVYSPPPLRGRGTADRLMAGVRDAANAAGESITPLCGYAATWLKRHSRD